MLTLSQAGAVEARFGRTPENRKDIMQVFRDLEEHFHGIDNTLPGDFAAFYGADDDGGWPQPVAALLTALWPHQYTYTQAVER